MWCFEFREMGCLPGAREEGAIEGVDEQDIQSLQGNHMLMTKLLDYILYYMCTPSTTIDGVNFALGSILLRRMFCNWLQPKQPTQKIKSLKESSADLQFGKHQIIIPDIIAPNSHVIDESIDFKSVNVIMLV